MIHDLKGEENMSSVMGMLFAVVKENSDRLKFITDSMSQEEVDYRGPCTILTDDKIDCN